MLTDCFHVLPRTDAFIQLRVDRTDLTGK